MSAERCTYREDRVYANTPLWCGFWGQLAIVSGNKWCIDDKGVRPVVIACYLAKHFPCAVLSWQNYFITGGLLTSKLGHHCFSSGLSLTNFSNAVFLDKTICHVPLTRYAKLRVAHALGMLGTFTPPLRVSDPCIHNATYGHARSVMHTGIANPRFSSKVAAGKTYSAFLAHAQPAILRIW